MNQCGHWVYRTENIFLADEGDHRLLSIELLKENQMEWWNTILLGQPEINLSKVDTIILLDKPRK